MIDLLNPVPGIGLSQFFGARPTVYKRFGLAGHEGVDYACPRGTPVMAAASGEVWRAGDSRGPWGVRIILKHHFGYTVYSHLQSVMVTAGMAVDAGQIIGHSGETGNATGPHLHFALALPAQNAGYACPSVMGKHWWHDPLGAGDAMMVVRGVLMHAADAPGMRCRGIDFRRTEDVW